MGKKAFLVQRTGYFLGSFFVLLVLNFSIPRMMPGDPTSKFVQPGFDEAQRQALLQKFGLNRPITEQFVLYLQNTLTGNFGVSFEFYPTPVLDLIVQRLPNTLFLMTGSILISVVIGVPVGALAAWHFGERRDFAITYSALFFRSLPAFWVGLLLLFVFGYIVPIFPLSGATSPGMSFDDPVAYFVDQTWHSVLPVASLVIYYSAGYAFLMRASLLDILPENYIRIAQTKGLSDNEVLFKQALKPGFLPVLTQLAFQIGRLIGGVLLIEIVFSYPGMGKLMYDAVLARDYPLIQGAFFFLVLTVLLAMFATDLLYAVFDPRVGAESE